MSDNSFNDLKATFEGRTVLRVEHSPASESIAKFIFSDGTGTTLFATELGYWLKALPAKTGHTSLTSLFDEFYDETRWQWLNYDERPEIARDNDKLLVCYGGKAFVANIAAMHKAEQRIIDHPQGLSYLETCAAMGDCWIMGFRKMGGEPPDGCPEELLISNEEWAEMRPDIAKDNSNA
jgi:hypothetical protein